MSHAVFLLFNAELSNANLRDQFKRPKVREKAWKIWSWLYLIFIEDPDLLNFKFQTQLNLPIFKFFLILETSAELTCYKRNPRIYSH